MLLVEGSAFFPPEEPWTNRFESLVLGLSKVGRLSTSLFEHPVSVFYNLLVMSASSTSYIGHHYEDDNKY